MANVFSRIPQPMNGINWEPSPSNYTNQPPPEPYYDTDFANTDFLALWGYDATTKVGRNDLQTIASLGANTVKMYNWNVPPPPSDYTRDHLSFLAEAQAQNLSVIVPVSGYFTNLAYLNRVNGTSTEQLQGFITSMVTEVYSVNNTPDPVIMWAIGNEFDLLVPGGSQYCEAEDIVTIAQYIVDAESALGVADDDVLAFTSPVSTALTPTNTSIPCGPTSSYSTFPGGCAINALVTAFGATGVALGDRFIASVNSYQTGEQLDQYYTTFPTVFPGLSFFYGELGWASGPTGTSSPAQQAQNIYNQFTTTIPQAATGSYYYGACLFEFSDELWKSGSQAMFGIYTFPSGPASVFANEGPNAPVYGATFPVDQFVAQPAVACLSAAFAGATGPTGCTAA